MERKATFLYSAQDASGAVAGCPPHVRIARKLICGSMRQPAWHRKLFAGFVGTHIAAAKPHPCVHDLHISIRASCKLASTRTQGRPLAACLQVLHANEG